MVDMTVEEYNKIWEDIEILEKAMRSLSEFSYGARGEVRDATNDLIYQFEGISIEDCSDYVASENNT